MSSCGRCLCTRAERAPGCGRLVLATQIDHTATALRTLALRRGTPLRVLAPGLLDVHTADAESFLLGARRELSHVEAQEVRVAVVEPGSTEPAVLAAAMTAPTLATAGARSEAADLLPLFDDELARFGALYQPIVDLADRRVVGHEALLRATTPDGATVLPDRLFPAAHEAGWTHVLDRIGRTTALRLAGPWLGDDLLFINFVPTSIYRPQVCLRTTEQAAELAGLRLDQLVFEVTEGHLVRDTDHLKGVFAYYRERGCRVALDDLGAGYSSLSMLVQLQPDVVKLDKDIVQSLPTTVASAVVTAIVGITHAYGGTVLAECVETQEQADAARELGVDLGQGWLFGRPVPPPVLPSTVLSSRKAPAAAGPVVLRVDPALPDAAVAIDPALVTAAGGQHVEALLAQAVQSAAGGVVVVDAVAPDHPVVYVNSAFERVTGYALADLLGRNLRGLQGPDTDQAVVAGIRDALARCVEHRCVLLNHRKDGTPWWNELQLSPVHDRSGRLTHYFGFQHDVTARVQAEQRLLHLAGHDALTGLPNRVTLLERLEAALQQAQATGRAAGVLYVDLDGFKDVNDAHGHAAGDRVLVEVAARLRAGLRSVDLLARHGGDEFVVVLDDLDPLDAARVLERVAADALAALARPVTAGAVTAQLTASIGTACSPGSGVTPDALLHAADAAMYRRKQAARAQARSSEHAPRR